jgi:hypothetical protein
LFAYLARPFPQGPITGRQLARISEAAADSNLLFRILLSPSDQQMITVELVKLDTVSKYHFAIVQNLSVLSFVVHDTTAVIVQDDIVQHRTMRFGEVSQLFGSMLITIAIQIPTAHSYWLDGKDYGVPVKCVWPSMKGNYSPLSPNFWFVILYVAILLSYTAETLNAYFPRAFRRHMDDVLMDTLRS